MSENANPIARTGDNPDNQTVIRKSSNIRFRILIPLASLIFALIGVIYLLVVLGVEERTLLACGGVGVLIIAFFYFFLGRLEKLLARQSAELRENEQYLQAIFDAGSTGIFVIDAETHVIADANRAAVNMVGTPKENITGKISREFICVAEVGKCPITDLGQRLDNSECVLICADGEQTSVLKTVVPVTLRGRKYLLDCFVDVSSQETVREALQRETAKLSAMISGMDEGVVFADADNVVVEANDYFCRFIGKSREEIIGLRLDDCHYGQVREKLLKRIDDFRSNVNSAPFMLQRSLGDVEAILRMQPIYRGGRYDGVLLNFIDVTEFVKARREAEAANQAKSAFLANMSHEIRTPLTAILGHADLLADGSQDENEKRESLSTIQRNGQHLLELINDILDISKIEAGKLTLDPIRCSIPNLIADVTSLMRVRASQREITLSVEYAGELPETILADEVRLRQMLVNLIGNAIKFTETGGVRVRISFLPHWHGDEAGVKFEIIDTGIGIARNSIRKLWEPFAQADASTTRRHGGTGLGLTITRRLAEMMGGEMTIESEQGKGSVFAFTIPTGPIGDIRILRSPGEGVRDDVRSKAHKPKSDALSGVRILLAEDGVDNQRLISTILKKAGAAEVQLAENGRIAMGKTLEGNFDVVLMDMQMPEMDGYDATRALRRQGYAGAIIALTAHALTGDRDRCIEAGCSDYCTKPINRSDLIELVARYSSVRQSPPSGAIRSDFEGDPEIADIIGEFVAHLGETIDEMRNALTHGDFVQLQRLAHQLKGAGGGYGYPCLSEASLSLEQAAQECDVEKATLALGELEKLCRRVIAGRDKASVSKEAGK